MSARPYRLTERVTPEDELHTATVRLLRTVLMPSVVWTCFPAGNVPLAPQHAAKLARYGLASGWPDFLVYHDAALHGLELKRRGGTLSKTRLVRTRSGAQRMVIGQEEQFAALERQGMKIAIAHSTDEVVEALGRWQIPCRIRTLVEMAA